MSRSRKTLTRQKVRYQRIYIGRGFSLGSPSKTWSRPAPKSVSADGEVVDMFPARPTQQRMRENFDASIRESWPGPLILAARKAIDDQDYHALDAVLSTLQHYP